MNEAEFSPDVAKHHVEAALADPALASLRLAGAPVLAIAGAPGRVVYANAAAQSLFAGDLAALGRRLLLGAEPGARRIVALSRSLLPGAAPRLERLRFFFGPMADTVTVLCRRATVAPGETIFAFAVLGVRAPQATASRKTDDAAPRLKLASMQDAPVGAHEDGAREEAPDVAIAPVGESETADVAAIDATVPPAPAPARGARFAWRTDRDHIVTSVAPALAAQVGAANADIVGRSFLDVARDMALDADGRLVAALAARDTFAGVETLWPAGEGERAKIALGAAPAFDEEDRFDGFRGYGVVRPERIAAPAQDDATPAAPHAEAASPDAATARAIAQIDAIAQPIDEPPPPLALLRDMRVSEDAAHETVAHDMASPASATPEAVDRAASVNHDAPPAHYTAEAIDLPQPAQATPDAPSRDDAVAAAADAEPSYAELADLDEQAGEPVAAEPVNETPGVADAPAASSRETPAVIALGPPRQTDAESDEGDDESDEIVAVSDAGEPMHRGDIGAEPVAHEPETGARGYANALLGTGDEESVDDSDDDGEVKEPAAGPAPSAANIVPLRPQSPARVAEPPHRAPAPELSAGEKSAFEEIGRALGAEPVVGDAEDEPKLSPAASKRARDLIDLVARFGRSDEPVEQARPAAPPLAAVSPESSAKIAAELPERNAAAVLERLPVGVVVSRFNVPIYANRTLLDLLDYADIDAFHAAGGLDRLFHGRAPDSGVAQIETRDGEVLPVDARVQAIDWDGQPATLVTLRRAQENRPQESRAQENHAQENRAQESADAAKARALELDLRQRDAEARELHAILDTATDGVAVLDADGRILSLNRSGEALFGCDQNQVAGEFFSTLVAKESQEAVAAYFEGVKSGGVQSVLNDGREIFARASQGGAIPVFVTLGRLGSGATPKFCAVLRDLTAWKKAERELGDARREAERASALKSDFLAKVSHEIRTPLNAILGFAEVIMDERFGPVGNDRYRDYMRDIHKSGEHVLSLVNDLLDLSKIEAGKIDLTFTSVDVNAVVAECVSIMQPQANRDRVVMRLSLAPNLPNIVADERSMRQIVLNLLSNAVKFNEPGGQAIVSTALTDAGHAVVRIKDTGVGMSDAELETALEPFRQVSTSRKSEGTGLGLPLTKALVEANRASFTIRSRKGEGTMVEVTFPPTRVLAE
ncbi:MAG TPA: histidine kinase dimerization/phospho-acceptor domain-containing protein [Rhodoblastus sp.]|nr:histidine kinase dimerization/phospho-acceptor domain-containing protein [Rhodoblastus sp.]